MHRTISLFEQVIIRQEAGGTARPILLGNTPARKSSVPIANCRAIPSEVSYCCCRCCCWHFLRFFLFSIFLQFFFGSSSSDT